LKFIISDEHSKNTDSKIGAVDTIVSAIHFASIFTANQ